MEGTVAGLENKVICALDTDNDTLKTLVEECGGKSAGDGEPIAFAVVVGDISKAEDLAEKEDEAKKVIVISQEALEKGDQNKKLYMKLLLLNRLQGDSYNIDKAKTDLGVTDDDDDLIIVVEKEESEPDTPPEDDTTPESESQDQP